MKNLVLILVLFSCFSFNSSASDTSKKRANKKSGPDVAKWKYFQQFTPDQKALIEKHWEQYFATDIYQQLDPAAKNVFPLKVDSYGSFYPDTAIFSGIEFDLYLRKRDNDINTYSIYDYFSSKDNRKKIRSNISSLHSSGALSASDYNALMDLLQNYEKYNRKEFYNKWDQIHFQKKLDELKRTISNGNYKRVIFYIHGYNVPYSLAAVQLIALQNVMRNTLHISPDTILFVPLFWSSKANKNLCLEKDQLDITNKTGVFNGGAENGKSFMYYSNRAYFAAITLRRLLNGIPDSVPIDIFSHSLGTTIATTALINTFSKLDTDARIKPDNNSDGTATIPSAIESWLTSDIVHGLAAEPLPTRSVAVFLSAPAIPGQNTFVDINPAFIANKQFYSCLDLYDEMLTKNIARWVPFVSRFNMSATSLGCDINEAMETREIVKGRSQAGFYYKEVSQHWDHDILTYLDQEEYLKFLYQFLNAFPRSQSDPVDTLKAKFAREYAKLLELTEPTPDKSSSAMEKDLNHISMWARSRRNINSIAAPLKSILFAVEEYSFHEKDISSDTRECINMMRDPYVIVLLERAIKEDLTVQDIYFKEKILLEVSNKLNLEMKYRYPYYNYETRNKKGLKFVSIKTGNDLFQLFQTNLDRDYTGHLLVELATDYLNTVRRRPLKTYQVFQYGFDVYTPSFYDTAKFREFNSYDTLDRPHGCFHYIGWCKKGLSKYNNLRWTVGLKAGIIGGRIGYWFQTVLHQDISHSRRPRGWDAQIASGGRLGVSFETKHEWQFAKTRARENSLGKWYFLFSPEGKIGTFMTTIGGGLYIRNKSLAQSNHNFITHRIRQTQVSFYDHLLISAGINFTYVQHNSMLEGYGIWNNNEWRDDSLTPRSIYTLNTNKINRNLFNFNATLSYTARYGTVFYNFFMFSPETRLGKITFMRDGGPMTIDLGKRWHYFGEVGVTFNL